MKYLFSTLCCMALSLFTTAQISKKIPVTDGKVIADINTGKIVVKEPKVHFTSTQPQAFSVVNGTIRMVSNFNVAIEAKGMYYIYQDVKGNPDQLHKEVKRGDEIGTMYFNDEKKVYNLFISIMKAPKQYLTHQEVLDAIKE
ncbi:MAG TPA: hypothetical protein PL009_01520 [Flavipsychrobacter sp.]|nr:hypothetical protein [Flavipsychrobacter sp.]